MTDALLVDLSHWNAEPDWAALKAGGIPAVILKATQGSFSVDPTFVTRVRDAAASGLLVGAYHFCDASKAALQAEHFLHVAGGLAVLAIDVEPNGLGETVLVSQAAEIVTRVQMAKGRAPLVYMTRWGPAGNGAGLPNAVLARCPLWIADYTDAPEPGPLPAGWVGWSFWQFTSCGAVGGCKAPVDQSRFVGDIGDLMLWWNPGP